MKRIFLILMMLLPIAVNLFSQTDCLDFTDLYDGKVRLVSGYYYTELECTPSDTDWFHVMEEPQGYDWRTDNVVKIIPDEFTHSVRIGRITKKDSYITKQIGYNFVIDTSVVDTLLFSFAIIGDKPSQNFHIDVIDESKNGNLIYGDYGEYIGSNAKWKMSQEGYWYKDWDSVYIDLKDYNGDSVRFRSMINVGETEVAYYYFTVKCLKQTYEEEPEPKLPDTIYTKICADELPYDYDGILINQPGVYLLENEDTICFLTLALNSYDTIQEQYCGIESYNGVWDIDSEGSYTFSQSFETTDGCDSIIITLIDVYKTYDDTIRATIEDGAVYKQFGFEENLEGIYTHTAQTINGCDSSLTLILSVNQELIIWTPTAITPQSDNNQTFEVITNKKLIVLEALRIYNRWGTLIFETDDIDKGWDGKYKDSFVQNGMYVYEILYYKKGIPGKKYRKAGEFMVYS